MRKLGTTVIVIMRALLSPIRILGKAPRFYTKSMMGCSGSLGCTAGVVGAVPYDLSDLPWSNSISSCTLRMKEEYNIAFLVALERKRSSSDMNLNLSKATYSRGHGGVRTRSCIVGVGKIGRIDEEKPCSFQEDHVVVKSGVSPRTRCRRNALVH